jgi:glutamine synthetase
LLADKKNNDLFVKHKVLNAVELHARLEILTEQYFTKVNIEAETTESMVRTMIIPAATRYFNELAAYADRGSALGLKTAGTSNVIKELNGLVNELVKKLGELNKQNRELGGDEVESKAFHMRDNVIPAMNAVRDVVDELEKVVADDYWPLPTYREMLFIK